MCPRRHYRKSSVVQRLLYFLRSSLLCGHVQMSVLGLDLPASSQHCFIFFVRNKSDSVPHCSLTWVYAFVKGPACAVVYLVAPNIVLADFSQLNTSPFTRLFEKNAKNVKSSPFWAAVETWPHIMDSDNLTLIPSVDICSSF